MVRFPLSEHFLRGRRFETFDQVEEACQEFLIQSSRNGVSGRHESLQIVGRRSWIMMRKWPNVAQ
ncbi:hypothetical protein KIN20_019183 [Parelaphostrongylus tenuis]|uniref:Uncharacterized protein n=1 Tax=Parelaphostrongylus tenuis TaxID=148309 RepID=A0AAD5N4J2_PARTN|nr:hypothetical protein KIN20_019183 [Parelaphostrongylus tenuis]